MFRDFAEMASYGSSGRPGMIERGQHQRRARDVVRAIACFAELAQIIGRIVLFMSADCTSGPCISQSSGRQASRK